MTVRIPAAALAALAAVAVAAPAAAALRTRGVPRAVVLPADSAAAAAAPGAWIVAARRPAHRLARAHGARRITASAYRVPRARARALARALRARSMLAYAEPDRPRARAQAPADPLSVVPQAGWRDLVVAGAPAPPVNAGSPLIALVDSPLDPAHPEVVGSWTTTHGGRSVADFHGTATATVAAAPHNGVGFIGIWPGARALNLPLPRQISCSDSARQIARAVRHGAAVINMSYGSSAACRVEYEAIQRAVGRGIVPVAAAGNEFGAGNPSEFPASLPHVLTVAAIGPADDPTYFSNQNAAVDLSAPGEDVLAGVPAAFDPDGNPDAFAAVSGTSFSAPMVAAAVAWIRAVRTDLTPDQASQVVRLGARDVGRRGWEAATGFGVLNVAGALARRPPAADPSEPNDDLEFVTGDVLGRKAPIVFRGRTRTVTALLDRYEDPVDVYRIRLPARSTVRIRVLPRFGDPDLYAFGTRAETVVRAQGLLGRSTRRGRRAERLVLRNPGDRVRRAFVALGIDEEADSLDAGYRLRIARG